MLGRNEACTDRSAAAPVAELVDTDPLARCKSDLEQFVANVRDQLQRMRRTLERPTQAAAATAADLLPPPSATSAAEPQDRKTEDSFAPLRDREMTAEQPREAVVPPLDICDSAGLQTAGPSGVPVDPQDQLQALKARLAQQLQSNPAAEQPLSS